jgi:hypothetical protein
VLAHIFFIAPLDHFFGDAQWNSLLTRMRRTARCQDQFAHFIGMIERQKLRNSATHGMTADNGAVQPEMIEHCRSVFGEHFGAVPDRWFTR